MNIGTGVGPYEVVEGDGTIVPGAASGTDLANPSTRTRTLSRDSRGNIWRL